MARDAIRDARILSRADRSSPALRIGAERARRLARCTRAPQRASFFPATIPRGLLRVLALPWDRRRCDTDAAATWAVADASVLSISADGLITPAKVGTTTVTATVGGAVLSITVRIK